MDARGRWWFGLTALAVLMGLVVQVLVAAGRETGFFDTPTERALNVFAFFTIQSNIIVGITSLLLALRTDRTSMVFRVARLTGIVAITITFVVFHVASRTCSSSRAGRSSPTGSSTRSCPSSPSSGG